MPTNCVTSDQVVVNSDVNELYATYEGVDSCGERLVTLITDTCRELQASGRGTVTHLSLIGYSMGGLMTRYAVGRLVCDGIIEVPGAPGRSTHAQREAQAQATSPRGGWRGKLQPVCFVTIATPHLGCWT
jgi:dienelactone hydrolase